MQITLINTLPRDKVDQLLLTVPFYRDVKNGPESWQYDVLLRHSRIVSFEPGEVVIRKGDIDTWMYFILKGQLVVHPGEIDDENQSVKYVTPGEVFGDLAMLSGGKRMANLVADPRSREIKVFGTDFSIFGALKDFSALSVLTKLMFYRNMVHGIRWKLEMYRMEHPAHALVKQMLKIPVYTGPKGDVRELESLYQQAVDLAAILTQWNQEFGSPHPVAPLQEDFDPGLLKGLE